MIKSEQEYRRIKTEVEKQKAWITSERTRLKESGLSEELIQISVGIAENMKKENERELQEYEAVISGDFNVKLCTFEDIGKHLIRLRLWKGFSQTELANRLGVTHAQVSRDERFEYQGVSISKVRQILSCLELDAEIKLSHGIEIKDAREQIKNGQDEISASKHVI